MVDEKEFDNRTRNHGLISEAAWPANVKALFDAHLRDVERNRGVLDQWNSFLLEQARNTAQIANRAAQNAVSFDTLVLAGEIDTTAQGAMSAKLVDEFNNLATQAVEAAVAAVPGTSAASQGTTGVAAGTLQTQMPVELAQVLTNNNTIQTALLAELAQINKALAVILVKVTGEAVEVVK